MKRIFIISLALLTLIVSFVRCDGKDDKNVENKQSYAAAEGVESTTSSIPEKNEINEKMLVFQDEFAVVKKRLSKKYPVILTSNISDYMNDAEKECEKLKKKHKIDSYERIDNSIYIQVDSDTSYIFEVPVEDNN